MNRNDLLQRFQNTCGYTFKNGKLLDQALTHDSNRVNDRAVPTYQRLEFLGDSVLSLVVSEYLYNNNPEYNEGQLSEKRKELTEAKKQKLIADKLNIKDHILFGQSVRREQFTGHHSFVESIIGAVYIDGGLDEAQKLIRRLWELSGSSNAANATTGCVIS